MRKFNLTQPPVPTLCHANTYDSLLFTSLVTSPSNRVRFPMHALQRQIYWVCNNHGRSRRNGIFEGVTTTPSTAENHHVMLTSSIITINSWNFPKTAVKSVSVASFGVASKAEFLGTALVGFSPLPFNRDINNICFIHSLPRHPSFRSPEKRF